jgi:hypothetical protein
LSGAYFFLILENIGSLLSEPQAFSMIKNNQTKKNPASESFIDQYFFLKGLNQTFKTTSILYINLLILEVIKNTLTKSN